MSKHFCSALIAALFLLAAAATSARTQEEMSPEDIEYYELNYRFAATLHYDGGLVIELTDFHLGKDKFRHMFHCGTKQSFMVPLRVITKLERADATRNRYTAHFESGVTMTTTWDEANSRKIYGILPSGEPWEGGIDGLRLVEIRIMGENTGEPEQRQDQDPG